MQHWSSHVLTLNYALLTSFKTKKNKELNITKYVYIWNNFQYICKCICKYDFLWMFISQFWNYNTCIKCSYTFCPKIHVNKPIKTVAWFHPQWKCLCLTPTPHLLIEESCQNIKLLPRGAAGCLCGDELAFNKVHWARTSMAWVWERCKRPSHSSGRLTSSTPSDSRLSPGGIRHTSHAGRLEYLPLFCLFFLNSICQTPSLTCFIRSTSLFTYPIASDPSGQRYPQGFVSVF